MDARTGAGEYDSMILSCVWDRVSDPIMGAERRSASPSRDSRGGCLHMS